MKKIKEGHYLYIKKCNVCKCKFVYDIRTDVFNLLVEKKYIKCPECNKISYTSIFDKKYRGDINENL